MHWRMSYRNWTWSVYRLYGFMWPQLTFSTEHGGGNARGWLWYAKIQSRIVFRMSWFLFLLNSDVTFEVFDGICSVFISTQKRATSGKFPLPPTYCFFVLVEICNRWYVITWKRLFKHLKVHNFPNFFFTFLVYVHMFVIIYIFTGLSDCCYFTQYSICFGLLIYIYTNLIVGKIFACPCL